MNDVYGFFDVAEFENVGEIRDQSVFDLGERQLTSEKSFHRRHRFAFARDDPVEIAQIGVHIERETVRRDPALEMDADRRDLSFRRVDAGQSFDSECFDPEVGERPHQHFLEITDVKMDVFLVRRQVYDRITDDLSEPVICNLAAAVGDENLGVDRFKDFGRREHAVFLRASADRENVRMLEQQKIVANAVRDDVGLEFFLKRESVRVAETTETANFKKPFLHQLYDKIFDTILTTDMKKTSNTTKSIAVVIALILALSLSAAAQKKPVVKKPVVPPPASLDVKDAKTKVANQIKNISKFMFILGTTASGLEQTERDMKAGKLNAVAKDKHNQFKQQILLSIRNIKAGLSDLETSFRSKPALRNYLLQIQGITELSMQSEDLASTGQFTESGRPFLAIIEKLTDTLAALPN